MLFLTPPIFNASADKEKRAVSDCADGIEESRVVTANGNPMEWAGNVASWLVIAMPIGCLEMLVRKPGECKEGKGE